MIVCDKCNDGQITDDMVERAARAMWVWDFEENTGLITDERVWPDVENPEHYRALAREALTAATTTESS